MGAPAGSDINAELPRSLRLHLWWTMALVLVALGGAGLAVAADRTGNPVERPELTYLADAAAQPWIDQLAQDLDEVHDDATSLSTAGRDLLGRLQALDPTGANDAVAAGDQAASDVAMLVVRLHDTLGRANAVTDRWRLGPVMANLFDQVDGAISAAEDLPTDWASLTATGRTVSNLVRSLTGHDQAVFEATAAGRDGRWADALSVLNEAASEALAEAAAARDQLAHATSVGTLNQLIGRERAYDVALMNLYAYLRDGGVQSGDEFSALQTAVAQAQAALPADNSALAVVVGETAGLPIADQLLAMEKVRGTINDALDAVSDAKTGGPPIDGAPEETAAP